MGTIAQFETAMKNILIALILLCLPLSAMAAEGYTVLFKTQGKFEDVRDMLAIAIESKGLKITHTNKVAEMLERTGAVAGSNKQVYTHGEQLNFCSATISRQMMEADPHAIVMCPYSIAIYTLPNDKTVYLSYRKSAPTKNPALRKVFMDIEKLLTEIIKDAI